MELSTVIKKEHRAALKKARETYGDTAQILVSTEELCELAAVCSKYPRYETKEKARAELEKKAVDEVADVLIVLDHIVNIFNLNRDDIQKRVDAKIGRLNRWLSASTSMEQTTVDRKVETPKEPEHSCHGCAHFGKFSNLAYGEPCFKCAESGWGNYTPKKEEKSC